MPGVLVAVEGPKSVGKTTLIDRLRDRHAETAEWVFTKEPTDSFDLSNEQRYVGSELAALIASDRARHVADVIEPALQGGRVVVTDRYVLSSFVFHCLDGVGEGVITDLNARFPRPDVLLILLCAPQTLQLRRSSVNNPTRLSSAITVEDELLGYITYANACRSLSGEIGIGYNGSMQDCHAITDKLITAVQSRRRHRD